MTLNSSAAFALGRLGDMTIAERLDRNNAAKPYNLKILCHCMPRLGVKNIKRKTRNETKARIADIQRAAISKMNAKGNKGIAV